MQCIVLVTDRVSVFLEGEKMELKELGFFDVSIRALFFFFLNYLG